MSLAGFIGGLGQGYLAGRDARSTWDYRQSIIDMRNAQARAMQGQAVSDQTSRYVTLTGAMLDGSLDPNSKNYKPGMNYQPGALAWAKANLPTPQYNQIMKNLASQGWTPDQIKAMQTPVASSAAQASQGSGTIVGNLIGRLTGRGGSAGAYPIGAGGASTDPNAAAALAQDQYMGDMQNAPSAGAPMTAPAIPQPNVSPTGPVASAIPMMPGQTAGAPADPGQSAVALNAYQQYQQQAQIAQAQAAAQGQTAQAPAAQSTMPQSTGYAAKGGAIRGYADGGNVDPASGAAMAASNAAPPINASPTPGGPGYAAMHNPAMAPAPAIPPPAPAIPPQGAMPAPGLGVPGAPPAPTPAPPAQLPPVPAGGMQHMHPPGLTPIADPKAPLTNVPPQAVQASTPAEAALKHGQIAFGLHPGQNPQAQPQQTAANYTELQHGAGAESNQMVQAAREKMFGPGAGGTGNHDMPLGMQNASLLNNLYNYDLETHGPAVAAADSFAVLQNYRVNMQLYGGAAASSFESGNLAAASHYLQEAYAFFPDGNDVTVKPAANGSLVATRTDPNGKTVDTSTFATPDDLNKFIMQSSSFETYNNYVAGAQKAQLDAANVMDQIHDRDADVGLHGASVGIAAANSADEIHDRDITTGLDQQRTNYEVNPNKPKSPPSATEAAAYGSAVVNMFNDPSQGVSDATGFNTAPASVKTKFVQLVTGVGLANGVDPATAASWSAHAVRNPGAYDPKTNTITIAGKQYSAGAGGTLLGGQSKATGGAVSPAARAMADLPSS